MAIDIAFSSDKNGNPVTVKNVEYIKNIIYMLFKTRPGEDDYNPEKGLDIDSLMYKNENDLIGYQDTVKDQFRLYTDISINSVSFVPVGDKLTIALSVIYGGKSYDLLVGNDIDDITQHLQNGGIE